MNKKTKAVKDRSLSFFDSYAVLCIFLVFILSFLLLCAYGSERAQNIGMKMFPNIEFTVFIFFYFGGVY